MWNLVSVVVLDVKYYESILNEPEFYLLEIISESGIRKVYAAEWGGYRPSITWHGF
jgi:hypothetical protein